MAAIIEIVDGGKLRIHHGRQYTVMTNSPPFLEQLAQSEEIQGFGGTAPLPGTTEAADRFVRAAYYVQNLLKPQDIRQTVAGILSVIRNNGQPFVRPNPTHPEASTPSGGRSPTPPTSCISSSRRSAPIWVRLKDLDFRGARRCASSIW